MACSGSWQKAATPAEAYVRCRNMNQKYLGDSYDLVKRFFCNILAMLGYEVVIDPMFTGEWNGKEETFYGLIGARPLAKTPNSRLTALFIDPDTGVRGILWNSGDTSLIFESCGEFGNK